MLILALDTTSERGGVGVFRGTECLSLVPNSGPANLYSVSLFQMADLALSQSRAEMRDVDLFAAANGPGSFTGIRVGLAAARAWGKAFSKPVRGISTLEAMANKPRLTSDWAFPIFDARRGEFFLGCYRHGQPEPGSTPQVRYEAVEAGWVLNPRELRGAVEERLANGSKGSGVIRAHDQAALDLRNSMPPELEWQIVDGTLVDMIATLAWQAENLGRSPAKESLDACYIRRPDAELGRKG